MNTLSRRQFVQGAAGSAFVLGTATRASGKAAAAKRVRLIIVG